MKNRENNLRGITAVEIIFCTILLCVFCFLCYYAFRYTYIFTLKYDETMDLVKDSAVLHLLAITGLFFIYFLLMKVVRNGKTDSKKIMYVLLAITMIINGALAVFWVWQSPEMPAADQKSVYEAILGIQAGNYKDFFEANRYLGEVKFQLGMVAVFQGIFNLAGKIDYRIIQYVNAFCIPAITFTGFKILELLYEKIEIEVFYCIAMSVCLPCIFYTPFFYGEILSMLFSLIMVWSIILFIKKRKIFFLIPAAFSSMFSVMLKGNGWIIIIAGIIILLMHALSERSVLPVLCAAILLCAPIAGQHTVQHYYENMTHIKLSQGMPSSLWIAMGMHPEDGRKGGWYNVYNFNTYEEAGYNTKKADQRAWKYVTDRTEEFMNNPMVAADFYKNKILTQWNAPSYECLTSTGDFGADKKLTALVKYIYLESGYDKVNSFMNEYQWLVYLGIIFACVFSLKEKRTPVRYLLILIIIGGFFFSCLWEAKTRYIFSYFIYLVMCASYGWGMLFQEKNRKFVKNVLKTKK